MKLAQAAKLIRKVLAEHGNIQPAPLLQIGDEVIENLNNAPILHIIFEKDERTFEGPDTTVGPEREGSNRMPLESL